MRKEVVSYTIAALILLSVISLAVADDLDLISLDSGLAKPLLDKWYDKKLPTTNLRPEEKQKLILEDKTLWYSNSFWKSNNCYYFDLYIGNETNITWSDSNRELKCTSENLSQSEIETLQLANVEWTLQQLGKTEPALASPSRISAKKGQNFKDGTLITE